MGRERTYYECLDGLRAICIIFTLFAHTEGNPGINGSIGVDVFFALSGYLITMLLLRERLQTGQVCLSCFYIRRFFRIVPLYALTIALYFPGVLLSYKVTGNLRDIHDFNAALPWLLSFNSEWRPQDAGNLFTHAWTLGIEEKFYILWPLLFAAFLRIGFRSFPILWLSAPLFLLLGPSMARGYIGILFGVTTALAVEGDRKSFIQGIPTSLWFGLMVAGYFIATISGNLYCNLLISLPAALFVSALISKDHDFYGRILSNPALTRVGALTYAIYLIHRMVGHAFEQMLPKFGWQPGFTVSFLLLYGTSIIAAWFLHTTIEKPMIRVGKRLADRYKLQGSSPGQPFEPPQLLVQSRPTPPGAMRSQRGSFER